MYLNYSSPSFTRIQLQLTLTSFPMPIFICKNVLIKWAK